MKTCPDTDTIATIAHALHWDVDDGLRHLQTCADCRARISVLASTHAAFGEQEDVDEATLARITAALSAEAHNEQSAGRRTQRRVSLVEAALAAVAAPVALVSSGVSIDSMAALGSAALLGAAMLAIGTRLRLHA